jgi:hypothetical protein
VDRLNRHRKNQPGGGDSNLSALELHKRTPGKTPIVYMGGHGFPLIQGAQYRCGIATDHIAVVDRRGVEVVRVSADDILDARRSEAEGISWRHRRKELARTASRSVLDWLH